MTDVAEIARSLTKAQREALAWLPADGSAREHVKGAPREVSFWAMRMVVRGKPDREVARTYSLCRREDGERQPGRIWLPVLWSLTPLGLAVRDYLKEQQG